MPEQDVPQQETALKIVPRTPIEEARALIEADRKARVDQCVALFAEFQKGIGAIGMRLKVQCTADMDNVAQFLMTFVDAQ